MIYIRILSGALVGLVLLAGAGGAAPREGERLKLDRPLKDTLEQLLPGIGAEQGFENPQKQWQEICLLLSAPGREEQRAEASRLMAEKLRTSLTPRARVWLLTQLMRLGRGECVAAVAASLDDTEVLVRDAAVRALAAIPVAEAGQALRERLTKSRDAAVKVALIHALGYRAEPASVGVLARELAATDATAASAAALALGKIRTPEAAQALAAGAAKAPAEVQGRIAEARLLCADALLRSSKRQEAGTLYTALMGQSAPRGIRGAALSGLLRASDDPAPLMLRVLAGTDPAVRVIAIAHVADLNSKQIAKVSSSLPDLPVDSQRSLLAALAARRDRAALPGVLGRTRSEDATVQVAAFRALGMLGDASTVTLLLETMAKGGDAGNAARDSLQTMWDPSVDQTLIERIRLAKDAGQKHSYLDLLQQRRAEAALPLLVELTSSEDQGIRRKAVAVLGRLGGTSELTTLLRTLLRSKDRGEREEVERAVVEVCERIPDQAHKADPVLAFHASAGDADKAALLPLLGRFGGARSLELIRASLAKEASEPFDPALQGLCNWPDGDVLADLVKVARATKDERRRQTALHGFLRVLAIRDDQARDPKEALQRLNLLKEMLPLATSKEDKARVLERAGTIRHVETARYLLPFLDQPETVRPACRGLLGVAHSDNVRRRDQAEFDRILDRVIQVAGDRGMIDQARHYKERR